MRDLGTAPSAAVAEVPLPARDLSVGVARERPVEAHVERPGAAPHRGLGVGDGRKVRAARRERRDRRPVVDVVRIGAAHPDDVQVTAEGRHPPRRDRAHVLLARRRADRLLRPARPAVLCRPRLHLPARPGLPGEIDARRVLVIERQPARVVVGGTELLAEGPAGGGDLIDLPGGAGPARVVVAMVAGGGKAREHDHRVAARVGRDIVHPRRLRPVEDHVAGLGRDRGARERADRLSARALDLPRPDARVVDVHAREFVRVGVRVGHVDGVAAALGVLRVGALVRLDHQVPRRRPSVGAVVLDRIGRVVVPASPEQVRAPLIREPDRVRVRVAADARHVEGKRLRGLPRPDVPGLRGDAVVHRRPDVARVEDDEPSVRPDVDRGVRVVVAIEPRGQHRGHPLAVRVVVRADLDVTLEVDPADVGAAVVRDGARVAEPRPGAVPDGRNRGIGGARSDRPAAEQRHRCEPQPPQHCFERSRVFRSRRRL